MITPAWIQNMLTLKACSPSVKRATRYRTFQEYWDDLPRGDWMMWALARGIDVDCFAFTACAKECALETGRQVPFASFREIAEIVTVPYEHGCLVAKLKTWKRLADVVRNHFPSPPELPPNE